jgi:hypothetical protein
MKKVLLVAGMLVVGIAQTQAQGYYAIPETGGNPRNLNTDAEWPLGGGLPAGWATLWQGTSATPAWSNTFAIPFAFEFNGQPVTHFKASNTGVVTFDTSATLVPTSVNRTLPNDTIPNNSVCIWGLSPVSRSFATGIQNYILTRTFGTAPNRQFWIYYNAFGEPGIQAGLAYFSVVLEEGSNLIHIVDQKTQCFTAAGSGCTNRTALTLGIQVDATTSTQITGSPNYQNRAGTGSTVEDNHYFTFYPGPQPAVDLRGQSVNVGNDIALGSAPFTVTVDFRNVGSQAITSGTLNYSINNGTPVTTNLTSLNVASLATITLTSTQTWTPTTPGAYTIKAWVSSPNGGADENVGNDTVTKIVNVWENFEPRKLLHEVFSSSTCPPCRPGNVRLNEVLAPNAGKYTTIKYQYNFPGAGDPYFTAEAQARGTYYGGVSSVPDMFLDGNKWRGNPGGYTANIFNTHQSAPSFVKIEATQQVDPEDKRIRISVTITPYNNLTSTTFLRVAVVERLTTRNVRTNGETEFKHVLKKFLPNPTGTAVATLAPNTSRTYNFDYTFPGQYRLPTGSANAINLATEHSVEEFEDLIGVVFLQDDANRNVLQSEWSGASPYTAIKEMRVNELEATIYPNPAQKEFTLKFDNRQYGNVRIVDVSGRIVVERELKSIQTATIDVSHLQTGMYFVEIESEGKRTVKKLQVAH